MEALDSAYMFGINPLNRGNLNDKQRVGLAALAPGYGLNPSPHPMAMSAEDNMSQAGYSDIAPNYFTFEPAEALNFARGKINAPTQFEAKSVDPSGEKPYYDPYYPEQSLVALRDWLAPKVEAGAGQSLQNRGLGYSGVGEYAKKGALDYLNSVFPSDNPQNALAKDLSLTYGPDIANSLISGYSYNGRSIGGGIAPGATPIGNGDTNSQAFFAQNPFYSTNKNSEANINPQFGLIDMAGGDSYPSPGYQYDPQNKPDASRMPWLKNLTSPTSGTSGTS